LNLRRDTGDHQLTISFDGAAAMLANILVVTFVSSFVAIVALGHVLLITAIWPDRFKSRHEPHLDTVAGPNQRLHHSK
jgi:hypothetical protein